MTKVSNTRLDTLPRDDQYLSKIDRFTLPIVDLVMRSYWHVNNDLHHILVDGEIYISTRLWHT